MAVPIPECEIEIRPHRDRVVLSVAGELDLASVPAVGEQLMQLRHDGWSQVMLDLGRVDFMDTSGVQFLLACYEEWQTPNFTVSIMAASRAVSRLLRVTGSAQLLPRIRVDLDGGPIDGHDAAGDVKAQDQRGRPAEPYSDSDLAVINLAIGLHQISS